MEKALYIKPVIVKIDLDPKQAIFISCMVGFGNWAEGTAAPGRCYAYTRTGNTSTNTRCAYSPVQRTSGSGVIGNDDSSSRPS